MKFQFIFNDKIIFCKTEYFLINSINVQIFTVTNLLTNLWFNVS